MRFAGLGVVSRQTALTYTDRSVDASVIGNELDVRYVVEGSIKRDGPAAAYLNEHFVSFADDYDEMAPQVLALPRERLGHGRAAARD